MAITMVRARVSAHDELFISLVAEELFKVVESLQACAPEGSAAKTAL